MPTNIDTGLTTQDAVHADHSPHVLTMSNGDLVVFYYNGTNLGYRAKHSGSWGLFQSLLPLNIADGPLTLSWTARNGDIVYLFASTEPIGTTHNADLWELTYNTALQLFTATNSVTDNGDGSELAGGVVYSTAVSTALAIWHSNNAGNFATSQQYTATLTIGGNEKDVATNIVDGRSPIRTGLVGDGTTTTYLLYQCGSSGTGFGVEALVLAAVTDTLESPPAPAANPTGLSAVHDGTNFIFFANENNAKLRRLTRTGANTYGSWTDLVVDSGIRGEPAVCKKANGDLIVFYRTVTNQANGEIWYIRRIGGTWEGSPTLLAGGASTGWSNVSCAANDANDAGNARVVYVTGTASTWTLVEDVATWDVTAVAAGPGQVSRGLHPGRGPLALARFYQPPRPTLTAAIWDLAADGASASTGTLDVDPLIVQVGITPIAFHPGRGPLNLARFYQPPRPRDAGAVIWPLAADGASGSTGAADLNLTMAAAAAGASASTGALALSLTMVLAGSGASASSGSAALTGLGALAAAGAAPSKGRLLVRVRIPPFPRLVVGAPTTSLLGNSPGSNFNDTDLATIWQPTTLPDAVLVDVRALTSAQLQNVWMRWNSPSGNYRPAGSGDIFGSPAAYTIDVHPSSGASAPADGDAAWVQLVSVTSNDWNRRAHVLGDLRTVCAGSRANWWRMRVTSVAGTGIRLQGELYDAAVNNNAGQNSIVCFGDSTMQDGGEDTVGSPVQDLVAAYNAGFWPFWIFGGTGGQNMQWLVDNWQAHIAPQGTRLPVAHVGFLMGLNDANSAGAISAPDQATWKANLLSLIDDCLDHGQVPVLGRIQWANANTSTAANTATLAGIVDTIVSTDRKGLVIAGPDMQGRFLSQPTWLRDGLHPTDPHYASDWRPEWATTHVFNTMLVPVDTWSLAAAGTSSSSGSLDVQGVVQVGGGARGFHPGRGPVAAARFYQTPKASTSSSATMQIGADGSSATAGTADLTLTPALLAAAGASPSSGAAALVLVEQLAASGASASSGALAITVLVALAGASSSASSGTAAITVLGALAAAGASPSSGSLGMALVATLSATGTSSSSGGLALALVDSLKATGSSASSGVLDVILGGLSIPVRGPTGVALLGGSSGVAPIDSGNRVQEG